MMINHELCHQTINPAIQHCRFYERRMLELLDQTRAGKSRADGTDRDGRSVTTTWAINVADLTVEAKLVLDGAVLVL
jgi:hypothetical protein